MGILRGLFEIIVNMIKELIYEFELYRKCVKNDNGLNEIYSKEICISPLKSLSLHLTNINSSYGLSPLIDYKELWEENEIND